MNKEGVRGSVSTVAYPPIQTEDELELVKRYVLLGIVMRILDHDIRVIGTAAIKLPRLYESILRGCQDRVLLDQAAIRKQFRETGIKVFAEQRRKDGLDTEYVCRGYNHRFFMLWTFVKSESEQVLKQYFQA